jgi:ABC-type polar amino acid transport system ATPase subunit
MADGRTAIVVCTDLTIGLGERELVSDLNFSCREGECLVITGPSGSGKSTLLRTLNGLCLPRHGQVRVLGSSLPGRSAQEARRAWRNTGTVLQDVALFETKSALGNVELELRVAGHSRNRARQEAMAWLRRLGLGDKLREPPRRLSGGQQQRVALARALSTRPKLLILDEPTSHLDYALARDILSLARDLVEQGSALILATHRIQEAEEFADSHIALTTRTPVQEYRRELVGPRLRLKAPPRSTGAAHPIAPCSGTNAESSGDRHQFDRASRPGDLRPD